MKCLILYILLQSTRDANMYELLTHELFVTVMRLYLDI